VFEMARISLNPSRTVTDRLAGRCARLSEAQLVEVTAMIAVENVRSRVNAAFGLSGRGLSDRCAVVS
jgi:alkylhydroperoxidase family enzyme